LSPQEQSEQQAREAAFHKAREEVHARRLRKASNSPVEEPTPSEAAPVPVEEITPPGGS